MSPIAVTVTPVQCGWSVLSPLSSGLLMFLSGDHAEEQARRLAKLAARLGRDAEVRIHHRDGDISVQRYAAHRTATPMAAARRGPTAPVWRQGPAPAARFKDLGAP